MEELIKEIAAYGGLPGLFILYVIINQQRKVTAEERDKSIGAIVEKVDGISKRQDRIDQETKDMEDRVDNKFQDIQNKMESNHKEINSKLDSTNKTWNQGISDLKDMIKDIGTNVAVMKAVRDTECKLKSESLK